MVELATKPTVLIIGGLACSIPKQLSEIFRIKSHITQDTNKPPATWPQADYVLVIKNWVSHSMISAAMKEYSHADIINVPKGWNAMRVELARRGFPVPDEDPAEGTEVEPAHEPELFAAEERHAEPEPTPAPTNGNGHAAEKSLDQMTPEEQKARKLRILGEASRAFNGSLPENIRKMWPGERGKLWHPHAARLTLEHPELYDYKGGKMSTEVGGAKMREMILAAGAIWCPQASTVTAYCNQIRREREAEAAASNHKLSQPAPQPPPEPTPPKAPMILPPKNNLMEENAALRRKIAELELEKADVWQGLVQAQDMIDRMKALLGMTG